MNKSSALIPHPLLPLNKLTKIGRRRKYLSVTADVLPQLDLSALRHVIEFDLDHPLAPTVQLTADLKQKIVRAKLTICPDGDDWPQPKELFVEVYCSALAAAAARASSRDGTIIRTLALPQFVILEYDFAQPESGDALLHLLRYQLDRVLEELPGIVNTVAQYPRPGAIADDVAEQ